MLRFCLVLLFIAVGCGGDHASDSPRADPNPNPVAGGTVDSPTPTPRASPAPEPRPTPSPEPRPEELQTYSFRVLANPVAVQGVAEVLEIFDAYNCSACHSGPGFNLASYPLSNATETSQLEIARAVMERVTTDDLDFLMPPVRGDTIVRLEQEEVELIQSWVDGGLRESGGTVTSLRIDFKVGAQSTIFEFDLGDENPAEFAPAPARPGTEFLATFSGLSSDGDELVRSEVTGQFGDAQQIEIAIAW